MPDSPVHAARADDRTSDVSAGADAYARIRRDVISCRLAPGAFVTEPELMQAYGIRKTGCRIALTRLAHEGFVRSRPRKGYQISPITLRDVEEVFTLRVQVEPLAARLAAGRVDIDLLRRLEAACRVQHPVLQLSDQIDVFMDANKAFHLAIAAACGNERLYRLLSQLMDEMSRLVALGFGVQRTKPEIKHDHNAMIDALAEGDGKRAETIARRHIETFQVMTLEKLYASLTQTGAAIPVPAALNGSGR
ncbi:GntR family transcriptional regulator [Bordetella bronchialis]|uniref:GntR family transcriptional regulator n=1 Tax=Bordetella bronchialis TaxID=463025 RepID=A0A193FGY7_9BORD|nr:GntR family transcriptional regulator [Bordetella bronchialis]ANN66997.1 GntR family transcriptional regulator [Bordetella bronchialis]ANN72072.1 GntR family transcriptional regulator [Bordetella bronchialis]